MEIVGALNLSDSLTFLATVLDFEYDALLFIFRRVTIYWVLDLLADPMSHHSALFLSQFCVFAVLKCGFLHGHKLAGQFASFPCSTSSTTSFFSG